jgi:glutaryl-CoA dehydrogenase (non-decarboxylating)
MELSLNEEQYQIHHRVNTFVQHDPAASDFRLERMPIMQHTILPGMASTGLLALAIPPQYGGIGGDLVSLGLAAEELETHDTAPREVLTAHTAMCGLSLLQWGDQEQKTRFLTPQSSGSRIGTAAFDIPAEDAVGLSTSFTARRLTDGNDTVYLLDGSQPDVRLASVADHILVLARLTDTGRMSVFIIERELTGVDAGERATAGCGAAIPLRGPLNLAQVHVHESRRLGAEGDGAAIVAHALNAARYTIAAGAIGIVKRCINHSLTCIDQHPEKKATHARFSPMIAQMFRRTEMARRMLNDAWQKDQGDDDRSRTLALAHWFATTAAYDSLADATQILSSCTHDMQPATMRGYA